MKLSFKSFYRLWNTNAPKCFVFCSIHYNIIPIYTVYSYMLTKYNHLTIIKTSFKQRNGFVSKNIYKNKNFKSV